MKILLAIDGSPYSDAAVAEVCRRPWPPQSEVRLITVDAPIGTNLLPSGSNDAFDEVVKQLRAEAFRRLNDATNALCSVEIVRIPPPSLSSAAAAT